MNQVELEAKVNEVFSDEEYVKSLFELDTPEEVSASLNEKGVPITVEDVITIKEVLEKSVDGELSDEALENVNGGCVAMTVLAAVGGTMLVAGFGALYVIAARVRW